jgi:NAD+ kinase
LTQRPIVVPGDQTLTVKVSALRDVFVTFDGQEGHPLEKGDRIEVQKSANRVYLVRNPSLDYVTILRQKLHWGER